MSSTSIAHDSAIRKNKFELARKEELVEPTPVISSTRVNLHSNNFRQFNSPTVRTHEIKLTTEFVNPFDEGLLALQSTSLGPNYIEMTTELNNIDSENDEINDMKNPFEAALKTLTTNLIDLNTLKNTVNNSHQRSVTEVEQVSNNIQNIAHDSHTANKNEDKEPNENLLNAFEEMFDVVTEQNMKVKISEHHFTETNEISSYPSTEISTVTETGLVVNINDIPNYNANNDETSNSLSDKDSGSVDDFNISETVKNSIMKSINMVVEHDKEDDFENYVSSTAAPLDDHTTIGRMVDGIFPDYANEEETHTTHSPAEYSNRDAKEVDLESDGRSLAANLELRGPNKNLSTKIMSNGVHVIVAGKCFLIFGVAFCSNLVLLMNEVYKYHF